jgi:hypothetical protein
MLAEANRSQSLTCARIVVVDSAVCPTRHEVRLAIGVEQNPIGSSAGGKPFDHPARLRIDDVNCIVKQTRGVDKPSVRRDRDITDEVAMRASGLRNDGEGPGEL